MRQQAILALALLAAVAGTCLAIGLLAHFSPVIPRYLSWQRELHRERNGIYEYAAAYADAGDYILVGQLPREDFSRGGVYFLGASDTMISIMPRELPPAEQALIRNYAMGDLNHQEMFYFLRNLIEEQNLLQAGGEKTTIFLGLFYGMTRPKTGRRLGDDVIPLLFRRHGFYTFGREGIHLVPMSRLESFLRRERIYANRFLRILILRPQRVLPAETPDPAAFASEWVEIMGPDWRASMDEQMHYLTALLDYLAQRKVRVHVIFPPRGTWHEELPFAKAYRERVLRLLDSRGVPVTDFTRLLPDEEFGDATHLRHSGQWKVHSVHRALAVRALAEMQTK